MKTVKFDITYSKKASGKEAVIRLVYAFALGIILSILASVAAMLVTLQWIHVVLTEKRHKSINNIIEMFVQYQAKSTAYAFMTTDERPPLLPE